MAKESLFCLIVLPSVLSPGGRIKDFSVQWICGNDRVPLPPRSPHLNASAARWVRSVKEEALTRLILCGECSLRQVLKASVTHGHHERPHPGKGNGVLMPAPCSQPQQGRQGPRQCRERRGGLLTFYDREAA
jgi:putative transposase